MRRICGAEDDLMCIVSDDDVEERAADWLACLDRGNASDVTHAEFENWCRTDPRNLAAYLRLLDAWNRLDSLNLIQGSKPRGRS